MATFASTPLTPSFARIAVAAANSAIAGRQLPTEMIQFEAEGVNWVGQRFEALSPVALIPNHRRSMITIRSGMSSQLRDSLLGGKLWHEPADLMGMLEGGLRPEKKNKSDEHALRSTIQFGKAFISDLNITEVRG